MYMQVNSVSTAPILIIGKTGQLARALSYELKAEDTLFLDRPSLDLSKPILDLPNCRGLILAAAYTAVDMAETESKLANQVNGVAVGQIAKICARRDIPLVHISTDYVFDGNAAKPWSPKDDTAPLNAYGQSKWLGEQAIIKSKANAAILRTSWVFDGTGQNFLTTMLRLSKTQNRISVISDQIGRPTYAGHLAQACIAALEGLQLDRAKAGLYHATNTGTPVSWADFSLSLIHI